MKKNAVFVVTAVLILTVLPLVLAFPLNEANATEIQQTRPNSNRITFYFKGITTGGYSYDPNTPLPPNGTEITGKYSFNSNAPDVTPEEYQNHDQSIYRLKSLDVQIGDYTAKITADQSPYSAPFVGIQVHNNPYNNTRDVYSVYQKVKIFQRPYHIDPLLWITLYDRDGEVFDDSSLPLTPPLTNEFERRTFSLGYGDESFAIYGEINCISLKPNGKCISAQQISNLN